MSKINVLVFPCGAENALEIFHALRYSLHVSLFGASSVDDHGRYTYVNYFGGLPNIADAGFDAAFEELVSSNGIDVVFATHDSVAEYLASSAEKCGVFLVNGNIDTARTLRSKRSIYDLFSDQPWCPKIHRKIENIKDWPVVVKPDRGQGGQDIRYANDLAQAIAAQSAVDNPVVVEYLPGIELTVDCFTDRNRRLVWVGPRTRERVRAGIAMRSSRVPLDDQLEQIAAVINERLVLRGPWFFQVKQDIHGRWRLLEAACRVAGSMVHQRAHGINLPLMAIHDFMGRDVIPLPMNHVEMIDRCLTTRVELKASYDHVYVDLDDTLIIDGCAVPKVVAFLYQCAGEGKRIYLLTRHAGNPADALKRARIGIELFDGVFHLKADESKSSYIQGAAIFIDNHFIERHEVFSATGIPVLDVDTISLLLR